MKEQLYKDIVDEVKGKHTKMAEVITYDVRDDGSVIKTTLSFKFFDDGMYTYNTQIQPIKGKNTK